MSGKAYRTPSRFDNPDLQASLLPFSTYREGWLFNPVPE